MMKESKDHTRKNDKINVDGYRGFLKFLQINILWIRGLPQYRIFLCSGHLI